MAEKTKAQPTTPDAPVAERDLMLDVDYLEDFGHRIVRAAALLRAVTQLERRADLLSRKVTDLSSADERLSAKVATLQGQLREAGISAR